MASDKPFIGYPGAPKPKKKAKLYQETWLDEFIQGLFGKEAPSGSVLEPDRDKKATANQIGQRAGVVLDVADAPKAALGALVPLLGGMIRKGGAKDLIASHSFPASTAGGIARSGFLDAPSIGITSRAVNDYNANNPQFIFAPGKLEMDKFEHAELVNRDGYFANPRGREFAGTDFNQEKLQREVRNYMFSNQKNFGFDDLRLTQMWPSKPSQSLAIAASPNFTSLAEFEKSPYGAAVLRKTPKQRWNKWDELDSDILNYVQVAGGYADPDNYVKSLARQLNMKGLDALHPQQKDLIAEAREQPSAMAELKIFDKLNLDPADTAVYIPETALNRFDLPNLAPLRDAGFTMFTPYHLRRPGQEYQPPEKFVGNALARLTSGGELPRFGKLRQEQEPGFFPLPGQPQGLSVEAWNDFLEPKAGGSPPLLRSSTPSEPTSSFSDSDLAKEWAEFEKSKFGLSPEKIGIMGPPKPEPLNLPDLMEQSQYFLQHNGGIQNLDNLYAQGLVKPEYLGPMKKLMAVYGIPKMSEKDIIAEMFKTEVGKPGMAYQPLDVILDKIMQEQKFKGSHKGEWVPTKLQAVTHAILNDQLQPTTNPLHLAYVQWLQNVLK